MDGENSVKNGDDGLGLVGIMKRAGVIRTIIIFCILL